MSHALRRQHDAAPVRHAVRLLTRWLVGFVVLGAGVAILAGLERLNPQAGGLKGSYFEASSLVGRPARTLTKRLPSRSDLMQAWNGVLPNTFAATWSGWLLIPDPGTYTFRLDSTERASIWIDGRPVATTGGTAAAPASAILLETGLHAIFTQYTQGNGPVRLDVALCPEGGECGPLAASRLFPEKPGRVGLFAARGLRGARVVTEWVWAAMLPVLMIGAAASAFRLVVTSLRAEGLWPVFRWILLGSLILNTAGVWWGLPAIWVPDELTPGTVMGALSQHFSHGWYDRWPPFHYYTLTATMSPMLLLHALDRIQMFGAPWPTVMLAVSRAVSLAAAAGIVIAVCLVGTRVYNRRTGLFGAAVFALVTPFLYYAKTANLDVPYIFWFAVSFVYYVRILQRGAVRDFALFGLFATLSICAKDQAYALYWLMPVPALIMLVRDYRAKGRPLTGLIVDRGVLAAVGTAIVVFAVCHNFLFNLHGFIDHVKYITGPGNENYRAFPPTLSGRMALLSLTGHLIKISWGWPMTIAAILGLGLALSNREQRGRALVLLSPAVAYYLGFVNVILYNYDRFVIPICMFLSIFAGLFFDWLLSPPGRDGSPGKQESRERSGAGRWRMASIAAVFVYTVFYSSTVDVLMIRDSRYEAEAWLREQVKPGELVGVSGPSELLPRIDGPHADVSTLSALQDVRPAYYVLSSDYAHAVPLATDWGQLIAALERETASYRLVAVFRQKSPWPWLPDGHPDLLGPREVPPNDGRPLDPFVIARHGVFSILRSVDPTIKVFRREPGAGD